VLAVFPAGYDAGAGRFAICAQAGAALATLLAAADGMTDTRERALGGLIAARVDGPGAARAVERRLLRALENARDGRLDRWLNRRFSRPLSRLLLRTPLTPNQVTLVSIGVGLVGAALVAFGGYVAPLVGLLVIQLGSVLDCCDGEIARLKFLESPLGEWLDISGDTVAHLALFVAIGVAAARGGMADALWLSVLLGAGTLVSFACVTYGERTADVRAQMGGTANRTIDVLLAALSTRDYHAIVLAFAVAGRLDWFLRGAAFGAQVYWLLLLVLLLSVRAQAGGSLARAAEP
jgi:phosphatidylglycerophosphate synthase